MQFETVTKETEMCENNRIISTNSAIIFINNEKNEKRLPLIST